MHADGVRHICKTVRKDLELNSMVLLTGPNMAGKSTILRQIAACSLLGACGLLVPPCQSAEIPYIDAFLLRTFSQDRFEKYALPAMVPRQADNISGGVTAVRETE